MSGGARLRPTTRALSRDIGTTVLLHIVNDGDQPADEIDLSPAGAIVWRMIGTGVDEHVLDGRLVTRDDLSDDDLLAVRRFVDELVERGALTRDESEPT